MKQKTEFLCTNCAFTTIKWIGCCPQCNEWNSFTEKQGSSYAGPSKKVQGGASLKLSPLSAIEISSQKRLTSGIEEWDRVIGGGILPGSFLILTGDPGIGKSTLLLQIAYRIAQHHAVIYCSSEESLQQVKNRAMRLQCMHDALLFSDQAALESIIATGEQQRPQLLIIDSIQNCFFSSTQTIPGTVAQLREAAFHLMKLAKENNIALLVTAHITKEGAMAGPKLLEHMVDGVFYLQGDEHWHNRILRSVKNRFGTINEIGFFEMHESGLRPIIDINATILQEHSYAPGSSLTCSLEGSRLLFVELQALCVNSKFSMPQRIISGIDPKQIMLIAAILEKYLKLKLSSQDIFFKVSGNIKLKQSSCDLSIALALLSSYFQRSLPEKSIAFGEISLTGHIKPAPHMTRCIREAHQLGITTIFHAKTTQKNEVPTISFRHVYELLSLFPEEA